MNKIELLIPARDLASGQVAINHGADALYVGAPRFGARQAAGNTLEDIEQLIQYAHLYGSKVYVTVNTLLFDREMEDARRLIWQLYEMGADALIIQDLGLLKIDLPPIALHASTQCHNNTLERILFLEKLGMKRAILARELDVEAIRQIRAHSSIELETFVHGALCVSYSGQCYISLMMTGRSGNRGECAQICRTCFDLQDANGKVLVRNKHLLSLRDMNRSAHLQQLIQAGITSFKVEGRLKDVNYVKNITAFYRKSLDKILESGTDFSRSGSGKTTFFFDPDPEKSFNRGFTSYFLGEKREKIASFDTPKAMGQKIGALRQDAGGKIFYDGKETLVNGDGLCFVNAQGELEGFTVNGINGNRIVPHKPLSPFKRVDLYRNVDKVFEKRLAGKTAERKIAVDMTFFENEQGFGLQLCDEDGVCVASTVAAEKMRAEKPDVAEQQMHMSLSKLGGTPFALRNLTIEARGYFLQAAISNKLRSQAVEQLSAARVQHFRPEPSMREYQPMPMFDNADYKRNITNEFHRSVYEDFGAQSVEYGLDKTLDFKGKELMVCKYCIRYEIGACSKQKGRGALALPLYLQNDRHRFRLDFDCRNCVMKVVRD
ncbi:MAG: U32 family peptidase [Bacteroidales bacterium]|nr:U32 family peptidase [Bacteroidales bacterium]